MIAGVDWTEFGAMIGAAIAAVLTMMTRRAVNGTRTIPGWRKPKSIAQAVTELENKTDATADELLPMLERLQSSLDEVLRRLPPPPP